MSFKVKAIYEYSSPHDDDLQFPLGQVITVTEEEDADWYTGEYVDDSGVKHEGIFPRNFVEKYEPVAPPRPTRTRTKKEPEPAPVEEPVHEEPAFTERAVKQPPPVQEAGGPEEEKDEPPAPSRASTQPMSPKVAPAPVPAPKAAQPVLPASPAQAPANLAVKRGPPPVSEKPTGNSFRDRIAAFNKGTAPPPAPFKPSGLGSGSASFIKKPFVAPPPSGNTYVPVQRDIPTAKVYRRDEDPEIKEREAENRENAEKAGLVPPEKAEGEEDQPKPLSLKERMALLQKQQQEQAQRHADTAAKKEKPRRPSTKPRMSGHEPTSEAAEGNDSARSSLDRTSTEETRGKRSLDESHPPRVPTQPRRKSSKGPEPRDGNEADMSGAGETTEDQEELTEREDHEEISRRVSRAPTGLAPATEETAEDEGQEDEDEEDEDDVDPEVRRREELRARMAKMSGGMGFGGMFGGPMPGPAPAPPKKKKSTPRASEESQQPLASPTAPPVPMMMLPGMGGLPRKSTEERPAAVDDDDVEADEEQAPQSPPAAPARQSIIGAPPPVPGGRPAPPQVPAESRAPPVPASAAILKGPSEGSESDDEMSGPGPRESIDTPKGEAPPATRAPPPPPIAVPTSPRSPTSPSRSYFGNEKSPTSPASTSAGKRASRLPPPVPGSAPMLPPSQSRPPPPPPPGRTSTADPPSKAFAHPRDDGDEEVTEYEGDYDTDIASSVPHKDALKAHGRESSFEDNVSVASPKEAPPSMPPPVPSGAAPRAVPPPPPVPSQPPPDSRRSVDVPRAAPPPPPREPAPRRDNDDDYDPYNYAVTSPKLPQQPPPPPRPTEDVYSPAEPSSPYPQPPALAAAKAPGPRQSLDARPNRRSIDVSRPSMESGFVANDIDLASQSGWWLQPNSLPPQLQGRKDIFFESEESQSTQRGVGTTITRDIYVLYQDYSQTVITVRFDPQDQNDVHLEQRHEGPPRSLRQDQLEQAYERFGRAISESVTAKKDSVVGDGTPQGLIGELLRPFKDALLPVGTRAYGALVYSNLANASTTQNDEIRPGDIISIRNAKFQGKHGPMHQKYSAEVGRPDHVGVVAEWDGTKKKVRVWEQGRESKKVKQESFKLDDLRSGEVKIWRVMPRSWVGWEGQN